MAVKKTTKKATKKTTKKVRKSYYKSKAQREAIAADRAAKAEAERQAMVPAQAFAHEVATWNAVVIQEHDTFDGLPAVLTTTSYVLMPESGITIRPTVSRMTTMMSSFVELLHLTVAGEQLARGKPPTQYTMPLDTIELVSRSAEKTTWRGRVHGYGHKWYVFTALTQK